MTHAALDEIPEHENQPGYNSEGVNLDSLPEGFVRRQQYEAFHNPERPVQEWDGCEVQEGPETATKRVNKNGRYHKANQYFFFIRWPAIGYRADQTIPKFHHELNFSCLKPALLIWVKSPT
ncbi:hypothetical protein [Henriciella aquimarina]|uniref:hypothetical protein n=1 Tax=Henriciella aquimarina TaxID=545261 RepID=UPI001F42C9E6|nr:hypothetical protein [Henriciella aquimarina]